jgi:hypothetical protein
MLETHKCDNCDLTVTVEEDSTIIGDNSDGEYAGQDFGLHTIDKLHTRLDPGALVPSGECPECGSLMYLVDPPAWTAQSMLREIDGEGPTVITPGGLVCDRCGGENIQCLDWVDVNTNAFIGSNESLSEGERWCEDCQDHVYFVEKKDYEATTETQPV